MTNDVDEISRELLKQAAFLKEREPVYERALALFDKAVHGEFGQRLESLWAERRFTANYERPLLLLAALRYDALCEDEAHPLYAAVAQNPVQLAALTPAAFEAAISPNHARFERALRERAVQTNETTRAVTWLWPASLLASAGERRSLALVDLGTSAGLNLIADDLPALWTDAEGRPIPTAPRPPIGLRLGLDISPLNVRSDDDATWLRACVWPSDQARLARLEQAIASFRARIGRADAPVLEALPLTEAPSRLAVLPSELLVLGVQTIVRDYLSPADRERYENGLREFLLSRPALSALIAELEIDPNYQGPGERSAVITARFADRNGQLQALPLASTHPHPRQLFENTKAVDALVAAFKGTP